MQASWSRQSRNLRAYASRRGSPQTGRVHTSTPLPGCPISPLPAKLRGRRSTPCSPHLKYALIALGMRVEVVVLFSHFPFFFIQSPRPGLPCRAVRSSPMPPWVSSGSVPGRSSTWGGEECLLSSPTSSSIFVVRSVRSGLLPLRRLTVLCTSSCFPWNLGCFLMGRGKLF